MITIIRVRIASFLFSSVWNFALYPRNIRRGPAVFVRPQVLSRRPYRSASFCAINDVSVISIETSSVNATIPVGNSPGSFGNLLRPLGFALIGVGSGVHRHNHTVFLTVTALDSANNQVAGSGMVRSNSSDNAASSTDTNRQARRDGRRAGGASTPEKPEF
jgi:hypothetical protein